MRTTTLAVVAALAMGGGACGKAAPPSNPIVIDGSSTVYPLTQRAADEYKKQHAQAFTVKSSSTGAGFVQFCAGAVDVADASRPITPAEKDACDKAGVKFLEVPIAYDAITVVVNRRNGWAASMTTDELRTIWEPAAEGKVRKWNQVNSKWPDAEIHLFGPDSGSGTFDYFTEAINGRVKGSRQDYAANPDHEKTAAAVAADELALGYLGYTYYSNHQETLRAVAIDDLDEYIAPGAIDPSPDTVRRRMYRPLSRPLFLYVKGTSLDRPEVRDFVAFFSHDAERLAKLVGGVPLSFGAAKLVQARVENRTLGSLFVPVPPPDAVLETLLSRQ